MKKRMRWLAVYTAVCFLLCILFSVTFICVNANHHCTEQCPVCSEIKDCENLLNDFSLAEPKPQTKERDVPAYGNADFHQPRFTRRNEHITLVSLKTKLTA